MTYTPAHIAEQRRPAGVGLAATATVGSSAVVDASAAFGVAPSGTPDVPGGDWPDAAQVWSWAADAAMSGYGPAGSRFV
ncbi:hypothetical protein [Streptomyces sp. NRRL S-813]|uniref:hypothetical protein n=1 Tax=Streptomyces sp. NRRL S-813 TaxID=1463919 RepID=UPI00131C4E6E|nr:hypothetical protein [Streptomyces sp. NRRL S-813]